MHVSPTSKLGSLSFKDQTGFVQSTLYTIQGLYKDIPLPFFFPGQFYYISIVILIHNVIGASLSGMVLCPFTQVSSYCFTH